MTYMCVEQKNGLAPGRARSQDLAELSQIMKNIQLKRHKSHGTIMSSIMSSPWLGGTQQAIMHRCGSVGQLGPAVARWHTAGK